MFNLGPIGQLSRTTSNISAAEDFYGRVLGLRHLYTFGRLAFFDCGGTRLYLQEAEAPLATESVIYFQVADVTAAHAALSARGAAFRGSPERVHKHPDGTEEWLAFFDDPEGRPLAIIAQVAPPPQEEAGGGR